MKYVIIVLVICSIAACRKMDFDIVNLNNNSIAILGHGGMGIGHTYPINSFESLANCLNLDVDGTELDVQMTKDGVLVAFHDASLDESTNFTGQIYQKTWAEIKGARYLYPLYSNYQVIRLEHLFANIDTPSQYTFFLDCKSFNPDTSAVYINTFTDALIGIINRHDLANTVHIELKRTDLIQALKTKRPDLSIFINNSFDTGFYLVNEFQLQGISIRVDRISKEQVLQAHENGTLVAVFRAQSKNKNIEAIEKNVDFIQADKLKHLIRLLK